MQSLTFWKTCLLADLITVALFLTKVACVASENAEADLPGVNVLESGGGDTTAFSIRNPQLAEMTVSLSFTLENLSPNVPLPIEVIVPPKFTTGYLVSLRPTNPARPWRFTWRNNFSWGTPHARQTEGQLYLLPFEPGRSFRVVQGHNGAFSHTGENAFAVDFGMPLGTSVYAAREGLVVLVRDEFGVGAPNPVYKNKANLIFVRHSDGTLGEYVHLQQGGMKVRAGDMVNAGQILGLSGNSGYSQGPHLHFMVFRAKDSKSRESLPIQFITKEGSGLVLTQGWRYTALSTKNPASVKTRTQ